MWTFKKISTYVIVPVINQKIHRPCDFIYPKSLICNLFCNLYLLLLQLLLLSLLIICCGFFFYVVVLHFKLQKNKYLVNRWRNFDQASAPCFETILASKYQCANFMYDIDLQKLLTVWETISQWYCHFSSWQPCSSVLNFL